MIQLMVKRSSSLMSSVLHQTFLTIAFNQRLFMFRLAPFLLLTICMDSSPVSGSDWQSPDYSGTTVDISYWGSFSTIIANIGIVIALLAYLEGRTKHRSSKEKDRRNWMHEWEIKFDENGRIREARQILHTIGNPDAPNYSALRRIPEWAKSSLTIGSSQSHYRLDLDNLVGVMSVSLFHRMRLDGQIHVLAFIALLDHLVRLSTAIEFDMTHLSLISTEVIDAMRLLQSAPYLEILTSKKKYRPLQYLWIQIIDQKKSELYRQIRGRRWTWGCQKRLKDYNEAVKDLVYEFGDPGEFVEGTYSLGLYDFIVSLMELHIDFTFHDIERPRLDQLQPTWKFRFDRLMVHLLAEHYLPCTIFEQLPLRHLRRLIKLLDLVILQLEGRLVRLPYDDPSRTEPVIFSVLHYSHGNAGTSQARHNVIARMARVLTLRNWTFESFDWSEGFKQIYDKYYAPLIASHNLPILFPNDQTSIHSHLKVEHGATGQSIEPEKTGSKDESNYAAVDLKQPELQFDHKRHEYINYHISSFEKEADASSPVFHMDDFTYGTPIHQQLLDPPIVAEV